jgi:hypothetical protein
MHLSCDGVCVQAIATIALARGGTSASGRAPGELQIRQRQTAGGYGMEEVFKMYAMIDDEEDSEPAEQDPDYDEDFEENDDLEEDDEDEIIGELVPSDDDEQVA